MVLGSAERAGRALLKLASLEGKILALQSTDQLGKLFDFLAEMVQRLFFDAEGLPILRILGIKLPDSVHLRIKHIGIFTEIQFPSYDIQAVLYRFAGQLRGQVSREMLHGLDQLAFSQLPVTVLGSEPVCLRPEFMHRTVQHSVFGPDKRDILLDGFG